MTKKGGSIGKSGKTTAKSNESRKKPVQKPTTKKGP